MPTTQTLSEVSQAISTNSAHTKDFTRRSSNPPNAVIPLPASKQRLSLAKTPNIPNEILQEIFLHCLPTKHNATLSPVDAPLLLTRICHQWRYVALSTPRLWTTLHIIVQPSHHGAERNDKVVQEWISRSGALPLSISFGTLRHGSTQADMLRYFTLLEKSLHRWDALTIRLGGTHQELFDFVCTLNGMGMNPFRTTRRLVLRIEERADGLLEAENTEWQRQLFEALRIHENPNLRVFELATSFFVKSTSIPECLRGNAPWGNLETLSLQYPDNPEGEVWCTIWGHDLFDLLFPKCTNLTTIRTEFPNMPLAGRKLALNKLTHASLHVQDLGRLGIVDLLASWDFPSLTSLSICTSGLGYSNKAYVLSSVVFKWGNALTSLKFTFPDMNKEHLLSFVEALPYLVQLHLDFRRPLSAFSLDSDSDSDSGHDTTETPLMDDEFLAIFCPDATSGRLPACPQLQYLRLGREATFTDKALVKFLRTRRSSPESLLPIKELFIRFGRMPGEVPLKVQCDDLVAAGLKLRLEYQDYVPVKPGEGSVWNPRQDLPIEEDPFVLGWEENGEWW